MTSFYVLYESASIVTFIIVDNKLSPLSDADLVFIDPIGTGYSRAIGCHDPKEFWGVNEDPKIIAEFIRRWINDNKRWNSPRYILGESYGSHIYYGRTIRLQQCRVF